MKYAAFSGVVSLAVLMQGCALQQQVDHRSVGGLSKVGIASDASSLREPGEEYKGLESVGVLTLNQDSARASTARRKAENAILKSADYAAAKEALGQLLYQLPGNDTALLLMSQLTSDPETFAVANGFMLDDEAAVYTVKRRDTLQRIAYSVYGTGNYYPFLMRLNDLPNGDLKVGQILKVPAPEKAVKRDTPTRPARATKPVVTPTVQVTQATSATSTAEVKPAVSVTRQEEDESAVAIQNVTPAQPTQAEEVETSVETTQAAINASGNTASAEEERVSEDAETVLNQASEATEQTDEAFAESESEPEPKPEVQVSPDQAGIDAYNAGQSVKAYQLLKKTSNLSPQGRKILAQLTDTLVDQPYQRGLQYYQDQKLNLAIDEFNKVLRAEPTHGQAQVYRARCKKLLDKLSNIE
jgi:tetratricopeptide (TPR) repeat protein